MIQRIQSIYIFLFIISNIFLLYMTSMDRNSFHFSIHEFDLFPLLLILLIIFSIISLLSFKNRRTQIKLLYFLTFIQLIILTLISILAFKSDNALIFLQNYQIFIYLLGLVLLLLSVRGIKKDQNLIESIDRIR